MGTDDPKTNDAGRSTGPHIHGTPAGRQVAAYQRGYNSVPPRPPNIWTFLNVLVISSAIVAIVYIIWGM